MTKAVDDLEAVRIIADTLESFDADARERILRWARERSGMTVERQATQASVSETPVASSMTGGTMQSTGAPDIKTFVKEKNPKSDVQFAATVAYYYQFKAPPTERKATITKDDVVEACRQVDRKRPKTPPQVLVNAYHDGLFDRGAKGAYSLNSVGENLVAMALPGGATGEKKKHVRPGKKIRTGKKGNRKKR